MGGERSKRKLTVTSTKVITSGSSGKGPWTLYEVNAVGEDGQPVTEKLRAFAELPVGDLKEYEVEKVVHEKYGVSYTLSLGGGGGKHLGPKVDEVRDRVESLEQTVQWLDGRLRALEGDAAPKAQVQSPPSEPPAPAAPAAPATADDDIPF